MDWLQPHQVKSPSVLRALGYVMCFSVYCSGPAAAVDGPPLGVPLLCVARAAGDEARERSCLQEQTEAARWLEQMGAAMKNPPAEFLKTPDDERELSSFRARFEGVLDYCVRSWQPDYAMAATCMRAEFVARVGSRAGEPRPESPK